MVMGTFSIFSVRRWAVTVISWIESASVVAVSVAVAACAAPTPMPDPPKIAAIAYDNFGFRFITRSLLLIGIKAQSFKWRRIAVNRNGSTTGVATTETGSTRLVCINVYGHPGPFSGPVVFCNTAVRRAKD